MTKDKKPFSETHCTFLTATNAHLTLKNSHILLLHVSALFAPS